MDFAFGQTVFRDRRGTLTDPYNPTRTIGEGDWDAAQTIVLTGAFVASSSSLSRGDATRSQRLTEKSLYVSDPTADVQARDRIRVGGTQGDLTSGTPYLVDVRPDADVNPFTGWQPVLEIPLTLIEG